MGGAFARLLALNPLIPAPLAGYSDLAFRLLCREQGAGLCFSEMISCHGLVRNQANTRDIAATAPADRPVAMQLFGAEPEIMGEAAAILAELNIDAIDLNMGCPVKKVVKKGAGAALMRHPVLAGRIIRAVVNAAGGLPVTVKIRAGWNHQTINAPEFARMAADCGAAAITIHGRTWSDGFGGAVNWQVIAKVKETVTVPVLGNGDLHSREEAKAMMAATGCDGAMIGRAAIGAPWLFNPTAPTSPDLAFRRVIALRHLALIRQHHPDHHLARIKYHLARYFKGIPGGILLRRQIYAITNDKELESLWDTIALPPDSL